MVVPAVVDGALARGFEPARNPDLRVDVYSVRRIIWMSTSRLRPKLDWAVHEVQRAVAISQTAEYALRATVWLAAHPDGSQSTLQIARGTRVPAGYLSKVMQELARAGLVRSRPGRLGGFVLARRASKLTVLDVVNAVEPVQRIRACPLGIEAHAGRLCPLHARLDEVAEWAERAFAQTAISQLLDSDEPRSGLCEPAHTAQTRARNRVGMRPRPIGPKSRRDGSGPPSCESRSDGARGGKRTT